MSGLARGIDVSAHRGGLNKTNGVTIGVLGCGIDVVYPWENKKLFDEITQRGAIATEFPMGTFPGAHQEPNHRWDRAGTRESRTRAR